MKVLKENPAIKQFVKSALIILLVSSMAASSNAQQKLNFPFQGGITIMNRFFKDSLNITNDIIEKRAAGTVIFKFTADQSGIIKKIIIYYADDYVLVPPLIEALKRSSHQWVIPDSEKLHDFIITFAINFNPPATNAAATGKAFYNYYQQRRPILSQDQIPIETATLLPTVVINYDIP